MNAILNVYNHYLSNYPQKRTGQHDTHKKSELKSIYNSIVKMNKESPLYKLDSSDSAYEFAIYVKEEARSLKNALVSLSEQTNPDSIASGQTAVSSNPDIVSVTYSGDKKKLPELNGFDLEIEQLASSQINMGTYLPEKRLQLIPDNYSFDIQINDLCYEFQFQVSHDDTNLSIQERLARLFNRSDIGIYAEVLKDTRDGYSALRLESEATGTPVNPPNSMIFQVSDNAAGETADLVRHLGLQQIRQYPQNASLLVDGVQFTSSSNTFLTNHGFELALKQVTPEAEPVQIGFKTDIDTISDTIKELTSEYNSMLDLADSYTPQQTKSSLLYKDISSVGKQNHNTLDSIGLTVKESGSISIDDHLLMQSLSDNMQDTFQSLTSFKSALLNKSDQIMLNPMDYTDRTLVSYPNPGKTAFTNPYITSIYSGMLFNSYC